MLWDKFSGFQFESFILSKKSSIIKNIFDNLLTDSSIWIEMVSHKNRILCPTESYWNDGIIVLILFIIYLFERCLGPVQKSGLCNTTSKT